MQLFVTLGNLKWKQYVSFWRSQTFWNGAVMSQFTSKHSLRSVSILFRLVTFRLKWWDGWAPQTICWGIFVFTRPVDTPSLRIDLSRVRWKAKRWWKKSLSCSCHLNPWHHFTFSSFRFAISFEGHSVYIHGRVSRFYDTPVWESTFYRSLCYVVCVHGLLSLE